MEARRGRHPDCRARNMQATWELGMNCDSRSNINIDRTANAKDYGEQIEKLKAQRQKSNAGSARSNKKPSIRATNATCAEKIIVVRCPRGNAKRRGLRQRYPRSTERYVERPNDLEAIADLLQAV